MSLTLTVDGDRWRGHLLRTTAAHPGIVPVAKGNGYGLGIGRLARRAQWLQEHAGETGAALDMLAIGTYVELPQAATRFDGDLLVLTPWRPLGAALEVPPSFGGR
ncbi:MAG: alanine racemase, partial [Nocardioides sp.]